MDYIKCNLKYNIFLTLLFLFSFISINQVSASIALPEGISSHRSGALILSNEPDYNWWYGCSATSAGMMMGYYDRNGYDGLTYDNLVPGGTAETTNQGNPDALANSVIASSGHIADFWTGTGNSGDDPLSSGRSTPNDFDCLADFMGTNQDSAENADGDTLFYYFSNGRPFYAEHSDAYNVEDTSGMYGIGEYVRYAGYDYQSISLYNQYIDTLGLNYGFTFDDYKTEIDAGRVTLIQVDDHTMFGYGYDDIGQLVYFHDTWNPLNELSMTWGGSYSGREMFGVTCLTLTGGTVSETAGDAPLPSALLLLISGCVVLVCFKGKESNA